MYSKSSKGLADMDAQSQEALLPEDVLPNLQSHKYLSLKRTLAIHASILGLYTFLFTMAWKFSIRPSCRFQYTNEAYYPAVKAIEYIQTTRDIDSPNPFKGNPSMEVDHAWEELLHGYNIRVQPKVLHEMGRQSVALADGSGDYWGILASYHNLHCLREIRHHLAPEYYDRNKTGYSKDSSVYPPHIEHCIESLRQYVMCKADATMLTWYWPDEQPQSPAKYYPQTNYTYEQQCVNWPKLQDWAISNSFELNPQTIFHPKYGYPW